MGCHNAALIVVAQVSAEVVIKLGVLQLLERQFVLQLEDGVLCERDLVGAGEEVKKSLKLLDGLDCLRLVELGFG